MDPTTADIAVQVYDLDAIAARLAATADYSGLTALLAAHLVPEHILAATRPDAKNRRRRWPRRKSPVHASRSQPLSMPTPVPVPPTMTNAADNSSKRGDPGHPGETGDARADDDPEEPVGGSDLGEDDPDDDTLKGDDTSETPAGTAAAVAYWLRKDPDMDLEVLADRIGKSLRSVYRSLPPDYPRKPGLARSRARQLSNQAGQPGSPE